MRLVEVALRHAHEGGERVALPVPVHHEVAHLGAEAALDEQVALVEDELALRLAAVFRRAAEHEHRAPAVEGEVGEVAHHEPRLVEAAVRAGRELEAACLHATARVKRAHDRGGVLVARGREAEIGRAHHGTVRRARRVDGEIAGAGPIVKVKAFIDRILLSHIEVHIPVLQIVLLISFMELGFFFDPGSSSEPCIALSTLLSVYPLL